MIRANALFIVMVISLVIGIISSSLIIVAYYQRLHVQKDLLLKKLDVNSASAINILLSGSDGLTYGEERSIDLYGDEKDTVLMKKVPWGIFEIGAVKAVAGMLQQSRSVLYGYRLDEKARSAIYLTDQNAPLSVAGNTIIKGTCFLPKAGVKRAYIEGQNFGGKNLVNGEVKNSQPVLPLLNKMVAEKLSAFLSADKASLAGQYEIFNGELQDTIIRSFSEKTLLIHYPGNLTLRNKLFQGNILLCSDQVIEVDSSCRLSDLLIFARGVKFNDYFTGTLQAFATDSIVTGTGCDFKYPSAFGIFKKEVNMKQPFIQLGKEGRFKGILFTCNDIFDLQQNLVKIGQDAEVEGQIFADGFVELRGKVYGNVTCNKFTLKTPSSIYENHLLNAAIDAEKLSPCFIGSNLISSAERKEVIKWLE